MTSLRLDNFSALKADQQQGILILDSGLGALSLLYELRKKLNVSMTAVADNAAFPYGPKSEEEIIQRVLELAAYFVPLTKPSTILLACNTASTVALPFLREKYQISVVGTVPAIKPAANYTKTKNIALLATSGTIGRPYVDRLIEEFAPQCNIIRIACKKLASLAEGKILGHKTDQQELLDELAPLLNHQNYADIDCLILGCTHFTFLREDIAALINPTIHIIDPAQSVASQVQRVHKPSSTAGHTRLVFTKPIKDIGLNSGFKCDELFYK